jgi:hypothetical protein
MAGVDWSRPRNSTREGTSEISELYPPLGDLPARWTLRTLWTPDRETLL